MTLLPGSKHMLQALFLNKQRRSIYKNWSNGKSIPISDALILWETRLFFGALSADILTIPFRLLGVPLFDLEYVDMSFAAKLPNIPDQKNLPQEKDFLDLDIGSLIDQLLYVLAQGEQSLDEAVQQKIHEFEKEPRFNCLVRHFLESIRSFARHAPNHMRQCPSFLKLILKKILRLTLKVHIHELKRANEIDRMAQQLQQSGILILYWDIPPIP